MDQLDLQRRVQLWEQERFIVSNKQWFILGLRHGDDSSCWRCLLNARHDAIHSRYIDRNVTKADELYNCVLRRGHI